MNLLALFNSAKNECGVSGSDAASVVGMTGDYQRILTWVINAWTEIQSIHEDWYFLRKSFAAQTVAGQGTYTQAQLGVTDWGLWDEYTFRNYVNPTATFSIASPGVMALQAHGLAIGDTVTPATSGALPTGLASGTAYYVQSVPTVDTVTLALTSGGAAINTTGTQSGSHTVTSNNVTSFVGFRTEIFMDWSDYDVWRNTYLISAMRTQQTRPLSMSVTPQKGIALGPLPASGYTIVGDYFSAPIVLSNATDTPALPSKYHMMIVYKVMQWYGQYESAPEVLNRGTQEYNRMLRRLSAVQLQRPQLGGALA